MLRACTRACVNVFDMCVSARLQCAHVCVQVSEDADEQQQQGTPAAAAGGAQLSKSQAAEAAAAAALSNNISL